MTRVLALSFGLIYLMHIALFGVGIGTSGVLGPVRVRAADTSFSAVSRLSLRLAISARTSTELLTCSLLIWPMTYPCGPAFIVVRTRVRLRRASKSSLLLGTRAVVYIMRLQGCRRLLG